MYKLGSYGLGWLHWNDVNRGSPTPPRAHSLSLPIPVPLWGAAKAPRSELRGPGVIQVQVPVLVWERSRSNPGPGADLGLSLGPRAPPAPVSVPPLDAMFSSPAVDKAVLEMSPVVGLNPLRGTMPPQDLLFQAQDGVLSSGVRHRGGFQPSRGGFYHCEHVALALACLGQGDGVNLPGLPRLIFQLPPTRP